MKQISKVMAFVLILIVIISNSMAAYGNINSSDEDNKFDKELYSNLDDNKNITVTGSAVKIDFKDKIEVKLVESSSIISSNKSIVTEKNSRVSLGNVVTGPAINITLTKTEIKDFMDEVELSMSYEMIAEDLINIKIIYAYKSELEVEKISIEDSVFGNTDLILHDDTYRGENGKEIIVDEMFQNIDIKAFYDAEVVEIP